MNSIKNAIVTMTMLAVGYGAYVVLSSPMPEDGEELSGVDPWAVPDVSEGKSDGSADPPSGMAALSAGSNTGSSSTLSAPDIMLPPTQPASAEVPNAIAPSVDATAAAQATPASGTQAVPTTDTTNGYADQASLVAASPGGGNATDWPPPSLKNAGATTIPAAGAAGLGAAATAEKSPQPSERRESSAAFEMVWTETTQRLQEGQMGEALLALSAWYGDPSLSPEQVERCVGLLDQLAGSVIYSQDSFLEPAYVVRDGDTLDTIALEYGVSKVFLARVNGIGEPYEIKPGESLKVVRGPFHAEISRSESTITLFVGRYYAGRFHARIGADLPAAPATYDVAMIEIGREYFDRRTGQRVEANDPKNPYGPRWIGLRGKQITTAHNVGIHVDTGVTEEGCLAVSMTDAEDLASILTVGSRVTVKD